MRFIVDANLSVSVAAWLRAQGHVAFHIFERGVLTAADEEIFGLAAKEGYAIVTCDLDFARLSALSTGPIVSVVLLRIVNPSPARVVAKLATVLGPGAEILQQGAIITVEDAGFRVRRLPISE